MLPDFSSETYKNFERISKTCLRFIHWSESDKYDGCQWVYKKGTILNDEDRKWLAEYDADIFKNTGSHLIYNYTEI